MTRLRSQSPRLLLAAAAAGMLLPAVPALAGAVSAPSAPDGRAQSRAAHAPDDTITCEGGRCQGTNKNDTIVANNATQHVYGLRGDDDIELDVIFTSGSSDVGIGGEGRDCIDGGAGNDLMLGGPGHDSRPCEFTAFVNPRAALTGGPGDDRIDGGPGNDSLDGIFDDDLLIGGLGNDLLEDRSVADKDRLLAGPGNDSLNALDGDGDDLIDGGTGTDGCTGDSGDRFVNCEQIQRV